MNEDDPLLRMVAMNSITLTAILHAISKQPGINAAKLTQDISDALMHHETNSEARPEGVPAASAADYVGIRVMLKNALPKMPIR